MAERIPAHLDLFEQHPDSILFIEGDRFVDCNPATVRALGFRDRAELNERFADEDGVLRAHPSDFSPPTQPDGRDSFEKANEMIAIAFREGSHRFEWDHQRIDGEVFPVEVLLLANPDVDPPRLTVIWKEIGEIRRLQDKLMQAERMEAIGRFVGGVAHDFNNLLLVLTGHLELMRQEVRDRQFRHRLDEMVEATDRATAMTQELLAVGRSNLMTKEVVDLREVVRRIVTLIRRIIGEDIRVELSLGQVPLRVKVDIGRLERSLLNLAKNSRDAMPDGGSIRLTTRERMLDRDHPDLPLPKGRYGVIEFTDDGCGMEPEILKQAPLPFFTTRPAGQGTGLGLASVDGFASEAGGGLHLQSKLGGGTTVAVGLPLTHEPIGERVTARRRSRFVGGEETVLFVEDEPAIRNLLSEVLREQGYRVLVARDGVEAMEMARASELPIQVLVTDVVMPRMGGMDLARKLRHEQEGLRVLLTSGYVYGGMGELSELGGRVRAIAKPYTPGEILSSMRELLDD